MLLHASAEWQHSTNQSKECQELEKAEASVCKDALERGMKIVIRLIGQQSLPVERVVLRPIAALVLQMKAAKPIPTPPSKDAGGQRTEVVL